MATDAKSDIHTDFPVPALGVTNQVYMMEMDTIPEVVLWFWSLAQTGNYDSFNEEKGIVGFKIMDYDRLMYPRLEGVEKVYLRFMKKEAPHADGGKVSQ